MRGGEFAYRTRRMTQIGKGMAVKKTKPDKFVRLLTSAATGDNDFEP
jgi:hypothetical protein